jgi:hypothetical protein
MAESRLKKLDPGLRRGDGGDNSKFLLRSNWTSCGQRQGWHLKPVKENILIQFWVSQQGLVTLRFQGQISQKAKLDQYSKAF